MDFNYFKEQLLATNGEESLILDFSRKTFFHGLPYVFDIQGTHGEEKYFEFRNKIAKKFQIGFHEVFIVGSVKLGFSPKPNSESTPTQFGKEFSLDSDIDVVLVNENLFEEYYKNICKYQYNFDFKYKNISYREQNTYANFLEYMIKGWMRPDKLPTSFNIIEIKNDWFDFFNSISNGKSEVGNYQINGGLYKDYHYLENYYLSTIKQLYQKISKEK